MLKQDLMSVLLLGILVCLIFTPAGRSDTILLLLFDDKNDEAPVDTSGNNLTCVFEEGEPEWVGGKFGYPGDYAIKLDGTVSMVYADDPIFHLEDAITIEAWCSQKDYDVFYTPIIFKDPGFVINGSSEPGKPWPYCYLKIADANAVAAPQKEPSPGWHHYAAVYDGKEVRFYIDGKVAANTPAEGKLTVGTNPLYIGGRTGATPDRHVVGLMDEVRISDVALPQKQLGFYQSASGFSVAPSSEKLSVTWGKIKQR